MLRHIVGQRYAGGVTQHASFEMGTPRPRTHFSGDRSVYQVSIVKKHNLSLSIHRLVRTFFITTIYVFKVAFNLSRGPHVGCGLFFQRLSVQKSLVPHGYAIALQN